jgi:hypothetical protein
MEFFINKDSARRFFCLIANWEMAGNEHAGCCLVPVVLLGEEADEEEHSGEVVDHVEDDEEGGGVGQLLLPHQHKRHHLQYNTTFKSVI